MKAVSGGVCAAKGFTANGIHCGIRKNHAKKDLSLIFSAVPASAAAEMSRRRTVAASRLSPMREVTTMTGQTT